MKYAEMRTAKDTDLYPVFNGSTVCREKARGVLMSTEHRLDGQEKRIAALEAIPLVDLAAELDPVLERIAALEKEAESVIADLQGLALKIDSHLGEPPAGAGPI